ncbi:hypothetical protein LCGC14_1947920 [marine sediment metagenome]|uniref:Uncharacterized protein n=1 Tax=marine sediment metagenome TaxID=412755 RepID=A0A0F9IFC3_9ZZZZ
MRGGYRILVRVIIGGVDMIFKCVECGTHSVKERLGTKKEKFKGFDNYYFFCKVCKGTQFELKSDPYQVA